MVYKLSKFGKFLACPGYPECKNTKAIREETGAKCPKCGGEILVKKSRRGKVYYGCEHSPKCDFMVRLGLSAAACSLKSKAETVRFSAITKIANMRES